MGLSLPLGSASSAGRAWRLAKPGHRWMVCRLCVAGRTPLWRPGEAICNLNEPCVFTLFGYGFGSNAPGISDRAALHSAIHHVNLSHGAAIDVLRTSVPGASL